MASAWELEHQQNLLAARSELEKLRATLPTCFTSEQLIVAEGRPAEEILAQVREKAIDLVVMGSYGGRSGSVDKLFFGSTAEKIVRTAGCPVLTVPLPLTLPAGRRKTNEPQGGVYGHAE